MRTTKRILTLSILVLGGLVLQAGAGLACTFHCVIAIPNSGCQRCEDTGAYTGDTCQNVGQCGCFYTHNTCALAASGIKADVEQAGLATIVQAGDDGAVCSAAAGAGVAL